MASDVMMIRNGELGWKQKEARSWPNLKNNQFLPGGAGEHHETCQHSWPPAHSTEGYKYWL